VSDLLPFIAEVYRHNIFVLDGRHCGSVLSRAPPV
jgi:hypothetical protein